MLRLKKLLLGRRAKREAQQAKSHIPHFSSLEEKQKYFFQQVWGIIEWIINYYDSCDYDINCLFIFRRNSVTLILKLATLKKASFTWSTLLLSAVSLNSCRCFRCCKLRCLVNYLMFSSKDWQLPDKYVFIIRNSLFVKFMVIY